MTTVFVSLHLAAFRERCIDVKSLLVFDFFVCHKCLSVVNCAVCLNM